MGTEVIDAASSFDRNTRSCRGHLLDIRLNGSFPVCMGGWPGGWHREDGEDDALGSSLASSYSRQCEASIKRNSEIVHALPFTPSLGCAAGRQTITLGLELSTNVYN